MHQVTSDVEDLENHEYLRCKSLKVTAMGNDIPNLENNRWLVYMFQEGLDKLAHLGTSCPMKRGGDQCRIKEDGKFNFIHTVLVQEMMTMLAMLREPPWHWLHCVAGKPLVWTSRPPS